MKSQIDRVERSSSSWIQMLHVAGFARMRSPCIQVRVETLNSCESNYEMKIPDYDLGFAKSFSTMASTALAVLSPAPTSISRTIPS